MTSLDEAAATLRVVIPGFLALRVIYWRGLRTQRTDLELVLWSLVLSMPIYAIAAWLRAEDDLWTLAWAAGVAIIGGLLVAEAWRAVVRWRPEYRDYMVATAWDAVLARPGGGWVEVRTTDGVTYQGWVRVAADSAQASELDLYLWEPAYVDDERGLTPVDGAEGVLIPRSSITSVVRFAATAQAADPVRAAARTNDPSVEGER